MKKLYILITNNISFDQRMQKVAATLAKDFEVTIIGSNTRHPPPLVERSFEQKRIRTLFQSGKAFYLEFNLRLLWALFWRKPELIYAVDLDTLLPATLISKLKKIPLIYDAHEYFTEVPELQGRTFVQKVWLMIERFGVRQASLCITVGSALSKIYESLYQKSFHVVRNVPILSDKADHLETKSRRKMILYQGAVNEGRGVEHAIRAMKHLTDFELIIVGGGPLLETCMELAESLKLTNVVFTGMLSPDQLSEFTSKAWLGLNLLEGDNLNYYYSLANKFFDYTAASVPSLNMNYPEYKQLIGKHRVGLLVESDKLSELHHYILTLEADENLYNSLKSACSTASKEWNWAKESTLLTELVTKLT